VAKNESSNGRGDRKLSALDRLVLQAMGDDRTFGLADDPAKETLPELWACLSTIYIGRDSIKQPAVLSCQLVPGGVQMRITDRDLKMGLGVIVPHLDQCLPSLEAVLASDNPPWVSWGKGEPELRKRKTRK